MGMSKATAIRKVVREDGYDQTNKQITEKVKKRFGKTICGNQIIEVVGAFKERRKLGQLFEEQMVLAENYLGAIGDKDEAVRLLNIANDADSTKKGPEDLDLLYARKKVVK